MNNFELARNSNTSKETLEKLSNDENNSVRCDVANNPNTSIEVLEKLSNDEDYSVRCDVANNPNTSKETLEKLSNDEDYGGFFYLDSRNTSIHIFSIKRSWIRNIICL